MSRELFKSMTYKKGKVFTRQSSSNVYPKYYDSEENVGLTKRYNELGETDFEKWFLTNGLMQGNIVILNGSNETLKRLNSLANLLWDDDNFIKLRTKRDKAFTKTLNVSTKDEKEKLNNEVVKIEEDITRYISSFYDKYNSIFKNKEREVERQ